MRLRRRVSLNSRQLDELDERIVITGIEETPGSDELNAVSVAGRPGQRVTTWKREYLDVTVRFMLNIRKDDMAARSELLEKINTWAAPVGQHMRLNYRPNRRLHVSLLTPAAGGDQFRWTNEFQLVFRAYRVPFWENENAVTYGPSGAAKNWIFTMDVDGNTDTVADFVIENKSGAVIKNLSLEVGNTKMEFNDSNLIPAGASLTIDHPGNGKGLYYLRIRVGGSSRMKARTGSNDFYVSPGKVNIHWIAERAVSVTCTIRGRYI